MNDLKRQVEEYQVLKPDNFQNCPCFVGVSNGHPDNIFAFIKAFNLSSNNFTYELTTDIKQAFRFSDLLTNIMSRYLTKLSDIKHAHYFPIYNEPIYEKV